MKRGRKATTSAVATKAPPFSASRLDTPHRRASEEAGGADEQHREDDREPADEPALLRVDGRRAQAEAELREAEEEREQRDRGEADADDPDVLDREGRAADVDRPRRERARELAHGAAPDPLGGAVDQDQEADGQDHDRQDGPALDRPDHDPLERDAAREGDRKRERERGPERDPV